jgi:hypothetical protein
LFERHQKGRDGKPNGDEKAKNRRQFRKPEFPGEKIAIGFRSEMRERKMNGVGHNRYTEGDGPRNIRKTRAER